MSDVYGFDFDAATGEIGNVVRGRASAPSSDGRWHVTIERGRVSIDILTDGTIEQIGHAALGNGTLDERWSKRRLYPSNQDWTRVGYAIAQVTGWTFSPDAAAPAPAAAPSERRPGLRHVIVLGAGFGTAALILLLFVRAWVTHEFPLQTGWDAAKFFGGVLLGPLLTIPALYGLTASWNDPGLSTETVRVNGKDVTVQRRTDGRPLDESATKALFVMLAIGITVFALAFTVVQRAPAAPAPAEAPSSTP